MRHARKLRRPSTYRCRSGILFPVARVHRILRAVSHTSHVSADASVYLAGVLQYLSSEILRIAHYAVGCRRLIAPRHLVFAIRNDEELSKLFSRVTIGHNLLETHKVWT